MRFSVNLIVAFCYFLILLKDYNEVDNKTLFILMFSFSLYFLAMLTECIITAIEKNNRKDKDESKK